MDLGDMTLFLDVLDIVPLDEELADVTIYFFARGLRIFLNRLYNTNGSNSIVALKILISN